MPVYYAETDPVFASYCDALEVSDYHDIDTSAAMEAFEDEDTSDVETKRPKNSNLSNRLPREDFAIVIPFDDRPPLMERCKEVLGDRMRENRLGYFLDGKPANTEKVVRAAGLKFADEEEVTRSPPTRRRKRRRPTPKT